MSFLDNSGQKVGDNSNAVQVAGDFNVGNTTTEVIAICNLVVSTQMAALRQEAQEEARLRATEFGSQIIEKLSSEVEDIVMEKLRNPDIQYAMNQSVIQVARKGLGAKSDLLKELIVSKIKNNQEETDLLIDHALDITPRLTTSEMKLISLIYYFRFCHKSINGVSLTEILDHEDESYSINDVSKQFCRSVYTHTYNTPSIDFDRITDGIKTIQPVDLTMLDVKGCISSENYYTKSYFELFKGKTGIELNDDEAYAKEKIPYIIDLINKFNISTLSDFNKIVINKLGVMIAENYLRARGFLA
ncbi:TPA: LPO_1073/Vpar_1526 family protein [Serratia marcescens]|uniref:LPO_1073/Vpar_1526 family protein n=2 Tax=Serratia TaxID=613 RepID=UPI0011546998|nr:hypothetical protein [Serratia marcescens]MBH3195026.1 hypothetical protein [Serratia marcescens]QDI12433.1 hypothetical protein FBF84_04350 [Serratia marcescens]QDI22176.1 hypothetical protein FBF90_04350 [Serratia marcescens]HBC7418726.1 hypothetical protein [Serratia marcescens]